MRVLLSQPNSTTTGVGSDKDIGSNFKGTSNQPRKLIFGSRSYFDPKRRNMKKKNYATLIKQHKIRYIKQPKKMLFGCKIILIRLEEQSRKILVHLTFCDDVET